MFGLGIPELLVILAIVLLIFGPKRLKNIGSDLGNAIKGFRKAVSEEEEKPQVSERVIDAETGNDAESAKSQQETKV